MLTAAAPSHSALSDSLFAELRTREFSRLDRERLAYLDYTGSALYGDSQLRAHHALLAGGLFGNPHSENAPSRASSALVERARADVLRFVDADGDDYVVCFTANASSAIKLVAESYPFAHDGALLLTSDNHNSVNGVREYARARGARVDYIALDDQLRLARPIAHFDRATVGRFEAKLFAFPAQSNFSGVHHPLALIDEAHDAGYDVLLDAAAFAPSNVLSLRTHRADFVTLSFYKIFGYPTGVGALIARRTALEKLRRPWFAGGTVDFASVQNDLHQLRPSAEGFEDGTPDFLNIGALPAGFALMAEIGVANAHAHVMALTARLLDEMSKLERRDGAPLIRLYGPRDCAGRGGTVAFNVLGAAGTAVPYSVVERRARDAGIALRGGCFCNPGAAERAFGFDAGRSLDCMRAARVDGFTIDRFAACQGEAIAVGAIRASVGIANNSDDVSRVISFLGSFA